MSSWQWDVTREKYYVFSEVESAYIYQDGTRIKTPAKLGSSDIPRTGTQEDMSVSEPLTAHPGSFNEEGDYAGEQHLLEEVQSLNIDTNQHDGGSDQRTSPYGTDGDPACYPAESRTTARTDSQASQAMKSSTYGYLAQTSTYDPSSVQYPISHPSNSTFADSTPYAVFPQAAQRAVQAQCGLRAGELSITAHVLRYPDYPKHLVTDPALYSAGFRARALLCGSKGKIEKLDSTYKVRRHKPGQEFFVPGKVIKVLWPEPAEDGTTVTRDARFGEGIYVKVRWFVVAKEGKHFSTCLPIQTYSGRGATMSTISLPHHSIAFSGEKPPSPSPDEEGMLYPIRIKRKDWHRDAPLDRTSRINYGKTYILEHNIKAYDYGNVHKDYLQLFIQNWWYVLQNDPGQRAAIGELAGRALRHPSGPGGEGDEFEEDEESEEEESEDEEGGDEMQQDEERRGGDELSKSFGPFQQQLPKELHSTVGIDSDKASPILPDRSNSSISDPEPVVLPESATAIQTGKRQQQGADSQHREVIEDDRESVMSFGRESVFSIAVSLSSCTSFGALLPGEPVESLVTELVDFFCADLSLIELCSASIQDPTIGRERFERNFRRLLKQFALDLGVEATTKMHSRAANFINRQSGLVSGKICDLVAGPKIIPIEDGSEDHVLGHTPDEPRQLAESDDESGDEEADRPTEDEGYIFSQVRQFIVTSVAFPLLREKLQEFVFPAAKPRPNNAPEEDANHLTDDRMSDVAVQHDITNSRLSDDEGGIMSLEGKNDDSQHQKISCEQQRAVLLAVWSKVKDEVVEQLVKEYMPILMGRLGIVTYVRDNGGQQHTSVTSANGQSSQPEPSLPGPSQHVSRQTSSSQQGRKHSHEDDNGDGGEPNPQSKSRKRTPPDADSDRLACHFYVRNPRNYRNEQACTGPGFSNIKELREHFERRHMQPIQCPRCWEELPTNESLMEHIRAEPVCANRDPRDHKREGITKTQIDTIKKKETFENAKAKLREEKWFVIWRMLFPNESVPMSPYYEHCRFELSEDFIKSQTLQFMWQRLAPLLQSKLECRCKASRDEDISEVINEGAASVEDAFWTLKKCVLKRFSLPQDFESDDAAGHSTTSTTNQMAWVHMPAAASMLDPTPAQQPPNDIARFDEVDFTVQGISIGFDSNHPLPNAECMKECANDIQPSDAFDWSNLSSLDGLDIGSELDRFLVDISATNSTSGELSLGSSERHIDSREAEDETSVVSSLISNINSGKQVIEQVANDSADEKVDSESLFVNDGETFHLSEDQAHSVVN